MKYIKSVLLFFLLLQTGLYLYSAYPNDIIQNSNNRVGIIVENDFFFVTDYYYSNGFSLVLQSGYMQFPILKRFMFPTDNNPLIISNIELSQKIYTPVQTKTSEIQYGDRPYAGTLTLAYTEEAIYSTGKISSCIVIGVLGDRSWSSETQNFIHKVIDNDQIQGWDNQIDNDIIFNLNYSFERRFLKLDFMNLSSAANLRLGTLNTDLGGSVKVSFIINYERLNIKHISAIAKNLRIYSHAEISPRYVLYNATLNGGFINRSDSNHTLSTSELRALVIDNTIGVVICYRAFQLEIDAVHTIPEFKGGRHHMYGRIALYYNF
ncbi:MAG: lipid A deacylase LpxR family protein [Bacteroidales bacterium]|nr:lipid A deacylase LpxR family protein [Bacteroidales bacterium]